MRKLFTITVAICMANAFAQTSIISTKAGTGTFGYTGDGGPAIAAEFNHASSVAVDATGNIYISDGFNNRIRKVNAAGTVSTIVGNGTFGYSGDGGPATAAQLSFPEAITFDGAGNLFIADDINNVIRKVNTAGIISTVAGNGTQGSAGDGGLATAANLNSPAGVTVDGAGNIYISDTYNHRIRKVNTAGVISTIAGTGTQGYSGDGGPATAAKLNSPTSIAVDAGGNIYIADLDNYRIRKINTAGVISTFAGTGVPGYSGDGGPATAAKLYRPACVILDGAGNLYMATDSSNVIRKVNTTGVITTIVGTGTAGYSGDGGAATAAKLNAPTGIAFDAAGNLYVADYGNSVIRKVTNVGQVGIELFNAQHVEFELYPNPATAILNVKAKSEIQNENLAVIDILGNIIKQVKMETEELKIDISDLDNGVYFINTNRGTSRFIKQ